MISNQTKPKMISTIDMFSLDSAVWPPDQSFWSDGYQTQHCSEVSPQSPQQTLTSDDYWIHEFEKIHECLLESDLNNEPDFSFEAMHKEVTARDDTEGEDILNYLDSTAFLSPVSLEPNSPKQQLDGNQFDERLSLPLDDKWNNTTGMAILEEILSANSSDSEVSEQCFDSELNVQYFTETEFQVSEESQTIGSASVVTQEKPKKRLTKRKVSQIEDPIDLKKEKPIKKSKTSMNEKKERKRNQNKSAANRYRMKKRAELETIEKQQNRRMDENIKLKDQLQKLQMEFKVVYPLAKAAFASDAGRKALLELLDIRVKQKELLD